MEHTSGLSALNQGDREQMPQCSTQTVADPLFAFIRKGEAVSDSSSAVTFQSSWEEGKNCNSYKAFITTANDERMPLEVQL